MGITGFVLYCTVLYCTVLGAMIVEGREGGRDECSCVLSIDRIQKEEGEEGRGSGRDGGLDV